MSVEVVGYYTQDACYFGNPLVSDPSITEVVIEDEEKNTRIVSPAYFPNIAPPFPKIYRSVEEIEAMLRDREKYGAKFNGLKELTKDVSGLKSFLLEADAKGDIIWVGANNRPLIYDLIKEKIKGSPEDVCQDVHLILGVNHAIEGQVTFINDLLSLGKSKEEALGFKCLVLEYGADEVREKDIPAALKKWQSLDVCERNRMYLDDIQSYLDYYFLKTKDVLARDFLWNFIQATVAFDNKAACDEHFETLRIIGENGGRYQVIAADLSLNERAKLKALTAVNGYRLGVREAFAVDRTQPHLTEGKDVVVYVWGNEHAEKEGLPKHIKYKNKRSKVISMVLNGGSYDNKVYFDRALRELEKVDRKWGDSEFALMLKGCREADIVVRLLNNNRQIQYVRPRPETSLVILR